MNLSTSLQRHRVNRFLRTPKNLHRKQSKLFRAARQDGQLRLYGFVIGSVGGGGIVPADADLLARLGSPGQSWRGSCLELFTEVITDRSLTPTLSCRRGQTPSTLSRERFRSLARLGPAEMSAIRSLSGGKRT